MAPNLQFGPEDEALPRPYSASEVPAGTRLILLYSRGPQHGLRQRLRVLTRSPG